MESISIDELKESVYAYFSPYVSQSDKKYHQEKINDYISNCFNYWDELVGIIDHIDEYAIANQNMEDSCWIYFPFQALSDMIEKDFTKIHDDKEFYKWMYSLYEHKMQLIAANQDLEGCVHLFNKFVKIFVQLAMYDPSELNFSKTLEMIKSCYSSTQDMDTRIIHIRFISKFCKFMYEDAYENLDKYRLTFKKESILKRKFVKYFIEEIRQTLTLTENDDHLKIDDIIVGMSCCYVFVSSTMDNDDWALMWQFHRYSNIANCLISIGKVIDHRCVSQTQLVKFKDGIELILQQDLQSTAIELAWQILSDIIRLSFEAEMSKEDQVEIVRFVLNLIDSKDYEYKALNILFEALINYCRDSHPGTIVNTCLAENYPIYRGMV